LSFEKRELILIAGIILFMIGLIPFMQPIYAVIIAVLLYFGIKLFVGRRKKNLEKKFGEGYCVDCGEKIINKKCPKCEKSSK